MENPGTIERKRTSLGRLAASVASLPDSGYCSLMSAAGAGTTVDPLRIALLVRTVDWADEETTPDAARRSTAHVHAALEGGFTTSTPFVAAVEGALRSAQAATASTQDYFSACAALLSGRQVTIAALGYVRAWLVRGDVFSALIEPHIRPPNPRPGASVGLLASIGAGDSLDQTRFAEVVLGPGDAVLITMSGELDEMPAADPSGVSMPEALLRRIQPVGMEPAIIVVVGGEPDVSS